MNILMIGQASAGQEALGRFLRRQGIQGQQVSGLRAAVQKVLQVEFDVVVAIEPLAEAGRLPLGRLMRQQEVEAGLLLLTLATAPQDRIEALEAGYDDVLSAPYDLAEVYARLRALHRRKTGLYQREIRLGAMVIRPDEFAIHINEQRLELTKKEFDILFFLARNRNRVVTKDQLIDYLWGEDAEGYDFLYAHLKNLRRKLRALGASDLIETVYGVGYTLRVS